MVHYWFVQTHIAAVSRQNAKWTADGTSWLKSVWPKVKTVIEWQLRQADQMGTMPALTNTYDEAPSMGLGGTNAWNNFLHLMATKAAQELAARVGDDQFAETCAKAATRAQVVTMDLLWDAAHLRFRGYVCNTTGPEHDGALNTDNLMADSLYGVLWAEVRASALVCISHICMFVSGREMASKRRFFISLNPGPRAGARAQQNALRVASARELRGGERVWPAVLDEQNAGLCLGSHQNFGAELLPLETGCVDAAVSAMSITHPALSC